jgi:hypothetical protein
MHALSPFDEGTLLLLFLLRARRDKFRRNGGRCNGECLASARPLMLLARRVTLAGACGSCGISLTLTNHLLREHLRRKHYPVQCDRCYVIFRGSDRSLCMSQLVDHRQSPTPCERHEETLREGISDAQWEKLDGKRGKKGSQEKHPVEKWFEIWRVLFPGKKVPKTPCKPPGNLLL